MNTSSYQNLPSMGTLNSQINVNDTSQKIQLYVSGRSLLDLDVFSKSDPYVKVFFKRSPMHKQIMIGKTETIQNDLNPNWNKTFLVDYIFEAKQQIRFEVYDEDNGMNDDFIGQAVTTIGALVGAKNQTSILDLVNPKSSKSKLGKLIVRVESCQDSNQYLRMKWKGRKLMNTDSWFDFWDKSDPYLKFLKIRPDNSFIEVARTEVIQDNLNPNWKPIEVSLGKLLANNEPSSKFKIQCWDWEDKGENHHQFIGQLYTTLGDFSVLSLPYELKMNNPKHKNPGFLIIENRDIIVRPTFMDYLRGGLQLNLSIAIDFTGSNGVPTHPTSLHYMNPSKPNQYQVAIDAVARILLNYDKDQCIPAFGFGAKPHFPTMNTSSVSHCFPLSGNPQQTAANGYEHLMRMYCNAIQHVELSGPTYFGPILRQAINISRMSMQQGSNVYQILLILTDGEIHDMDQTVNLLVNNCQLPLSLIIVGVGSAEFTNMQRLDGDNGLYASNGKKAMRDIVQFVPFRQVQLNPDLLAQELLAELPTQVTQYMTMIGKQPGPPQQANIELMMQQRMEMKPEQALKNQLMNLFQQNPNQFGQGKM